MELNNLILLAKILRTACQYYNHTNSLIADNMIADTEGADIPYSGREFKELSNKYRKQFDMLINEMEELVNIDEIVEG